MSKLSKRAITLFVITIFLTVMIPIVPVMADVELPYLVQDSGGGSATYSTTESYSEPYSVYIDTGANVPTGDMGRIRFMMSSDTTLGDIETISWKYFHLAGYPPHVDVYLDTSGDGNFDDCLTFEYANNNLTLRASDVGPTYGALTGGWYTTFSDDGNGPAVVDNASIAWSNSGTPINNLFLHSLEDWKEGITSGTHYIDADTRVVLIQVQMDSYLIQSQAYIDDIEINGVTYNMDTDLPEDPGFTIDYVTPGNVDYGDVIAVMGSGVTSGSTVNVYWDFVTASALLNSTTGLPSGNFECTVTVPSAHYGNHYLWVKDLASGISVRSDAIFVVPKLKLSPSSGLKTDDITLKGYGFTKDSDIDIDLDTLSDDGGLDVDETDALGYFEYIFEVDASLIGPYTVSATDAAAKTAEATFTVGAAITLDKTVGPAGTVVKVDGRGFEAGTIIRSENNITLDSIIPASTKDGNNVTASSTGAFTLYVVIPSVEEGDYKITVDDGEGNIAKASFEVDGETSITVTPSYGTPGTVLTVKGYNFTRVSGTDVELALEDQKATATTDASGSFTATIIIPPLDFGVTYPVTANDTRLCHAEDDVLVALMVLQLSEYSAPVGEKIMLMGSGLTEDGLWNATFGDMKLIEDSTTTSGTTYFSKDFWVPSVPSGTYTIGVYDVARKITVNIDFTVTEQAALSVSRAAIPNGYNLTLTGVNFVELVDQDSEWWIYNSTDAWLIDDNVTQGTAATVTPAPVTDKYGDITAWYVIPKFLELGSYTINCTTVSNAPGGETWVVNQTAEVDIELVPEEVLINVGNPSYARGQTITFVIKATLKKDPFYLGIKDPEGSEVFNSTWLTADWKTLGSWYYIPSNLQIDDNTAWLYTLPADAMAGTWTYEFWTTEKVYAKGFFEVTQLTEIEQLQQDIGEIIAGIAGMGASNAELAALVADLQGASAEAVAAAAAAAAAAGDAQTAAEAAMAAISDVDDTAGAALDAANDAKSAADAAKAAADAGLQAANAAQATSQAAADSAQDAADAAEANQRSTSGLTTLVYGAIGASLIAALAAIVSLMQISRRIAG